MALRPGKGILVIDDEPLTVQRHLQALKRHDYKIYLVHKIEDAISHLQSADSIELILMDMDLNAKVNGAELAEKLLSIKTVPIIFLTHHTEKSYMEEAGKVPNYGYLSKDSSESVLLESVSMALRLAEDRRIVEESEQKYRNLFEAVPDAIFLVDIETLEIIEANSAAERMYGYPKNEFLQLKATDLSTDPESAEKSIQDPALTNMVVRSHRRKNGSTFPVEIRLNRSVINNRNINVSIIRDITEHQQREEERQNSDYLLSETQKMAQIGSWTFDILNDRIYWTDEVYRIFGLEPKAFAATYEAFLEAVHPADRSRVDEAYMSSLEQGQDSYEIEHRVICKNSGEIRYAHGRCSHIRNADGAIVRSIGMVQDITEYRQKENALRQSESELRHLFETMIEGFIWTDTEGTIVMANNAAADMFAYGIPSELMGLQVKDLHKEPEKLNEHLSLLNWEDPIFNLDFQGKKRDGTTVWMLANIKVLRTHKGEEIGTEILLRDITDRKEKEEELKLLRRAVEEAPLSIIMTDTGGKIEYVNPFFCTITGYSAEEVLGENPRVLKSGAHDDQFYSDMWKTLKQGEDWQNEICNKNKWGRLYWEFATIAPVRNEEGIPTHYLAIKEDITERKELERLKEEVDRMTQHDIRSPLNGIIGIPQVLMDEANLTDSQREYLQMIIDSGRSVLNMINLSLTIYQIERGIYEYSKNHFDLLKLVKQSLGDTEIISKSKNLKINISTVGFASQNPDSVLVEGEALLAYSVISNLLKNAVEASPEGQSLEVEITHNSDILFSVHNKGVVPEKIRNSFFDKYSTYGKDGGSGIGTYSAKILSEAQGWYIEMQTHEAHGTKISVTMPAAD
ncbi:MAG TPA: PAS domain S-box protein [Clostridia bacterium]|nr:PAS domain S-box protein [Clostridia bacterium]